MSERAYAVTCLCAIWCDSCVAYREGFFELAKEFPRARGALETGCDGVIASGLEAARLKAQFKDRLLVVTPGIRPVEGKEQAKMRDDQKRTVDVAQAFAAGADYIVVGRPIREAADPRAAAVAIQETIARIFPATAAGA